MRHHQLTEYINVVVVCVGRWQGHARTSPRSIRVRRLPHSKDRPVQSALGGYGVACGRHLLAQRHAHRQMRSTEVPLLQHGEGSCCWSNLALPQLDSEVGAGKCLRLGDKPTHSVSRRCFFARAHRILRYRDRNCHRHHSQHHPLYHLVIKVLPCQRTRASVLGTGRTDAKGW